MRLRVARRWPVRLKGPKRMDVECDDAAPITYFKNVHTRNRSFKKKMSNSGSKVAN